MKPRNQLSTYCRVIGTFVLGGGLLALAAPAAFAAFADVTTLAGSGIAGSVNGTGTAASFKSPEGVTTDASGNIFVADSGNGMIRKITAAGVVTTFAGSLSSGNVDGIGTAASFRTPTGMATDSLGNIYVADTSNNSIRRITPGGVVTTFAGSGLAGSTDANGMAASFKQPQDVAVASSGNIYVADGGNHKIRMITPAGDVTTIAGSGVSGFVNGNGASASFADPTGLTVDGGGNVFVADFFNHVIRKITPLGGVTTFAGSGGSSTIDGTGTAASFVNPYKIATDSTGTMYVADRNGYVIRMLTSSAVVTTLAGGAGGGSLDGNGIAASLNAPAGIAADAFGHLYVTEDNGNVIRRIDISGSSPLPTTTTTVLATTTAPPIITTTTAPVTTTAAPVTTTTGPTATTSAGAPLIVPSVVPVSVSATTTTTSAPSSAGPERPSVTATTTPGAKDVKPAAVAPAAIAAPATPVVGPVAYTG